MGLRSRGDGDGIHFPRMTAITSRVIEFGGDPAKTPGSQTEFA